MDTPAPKQKVPREPAPLVSFGDFVMGHSVSMVWAEGLSQYLTANGGTAPRSVAAWQAALADYQALS